MLAIMDGTITPDDMKHWEDKYLNEMKAGGATNETRFKYAQSIIKSRYFSSREDMDRAIRLLEDLCVTDDPEARKDYLFDLGIAYTKVGDYCRADLCVKKFLVIEPGNKQAHELYDIIHEKQRKDRLKEAAVAGGTAVLIGGLVGLGMALAHRR